jgi:hypothetical protein
MKKLAVLLLVLLFTLAAAVPASADKPVPYYDKTYEELMTVAQCDGFDVMVRSDVHETALDYRDKAGNWIRSLVQREGTDHMYKSTAPLVDVATGLFKMSLHVEVLSPPPKLITQVKFTGTALNIHLPNGVALRASGQQVIEVEGDPAAPDKETLIKFVGHVDWDEDAICAALQ